MKFKHLFFSLLAAAGVGSCAVAGEAAAEPQRYHVFYDGGLMIPGEDAPGYKKAIYNATGTAFGVELGVGLWAIDNQAPGYNSNNAVGLLWARERRRLAARGCDGFLGAGSRHG